MLYSHTVLKHNDYIERKGEKNSLIVYTLLNSVRYDCTLWWGYDQWTSTPK